eukprot:47392-Eustigmatos_ZCMA.PRE.1
MMCRKRKESKRSHNVTQEDTHKHSRQARACGVIPNFVSAIQRIYPTLGAGRLVPVATRELPRIRALNADVESKYTEDHADADS